MIVWSDGRLIPEEEAVVPIAAHGALYGDGIFETVRVYHGTPFRLDRHIDRLSAGAAVIELDLGWGPEALAAATEAVLRADGLREAVVRITAMRGVGPPGPDPTDCGPALVFITARATSGYPERIYREGARAVVADTRQNEHSPLCHVKSASYLNHVLARVAARRAGADEALLLNTRGNVAEGSVSNLFARFGDRILTPSLACGCLPGIARAEVLELAPTLGFAPEETPLPRDALLQADEAFLTNSLMEVAPLVKVGEQSIGSGTPGPAAQQLRRAYLERVGLRVET